MSESNNVDNIVKYLEEKTKIDPIQEEEEIQKLNININNNEISSSFIPQDKSFRVDIIRKDLLFPYNNIKYKCILRFYDYIGKPIYEMIMSELDFWIYIDSLYAYFNEPLPDIYITLNSNITDYRYNFIKVINVDMNKIDYSEILALNYSHIYEIFNYVTDNDDGSLVKRIRMNLTNNDMDIFIMKQYYTFLMNVNKEDIIDTEYIKKYLNDTYRDLY